MRKENSSFKTKFISEAGSYLQNHDFFAFVEMEDCACYCIADGIDEDTKSESAKIAVSAIIEAFHENPHFSKGAIKQYLVIAHEELHRETTNARLEASIVIILTNYKKIIWGHAGNSRLYLVRNENIKYRTVDHSLSQNLADEGQIPIDQIDFHEERHNLFSYVGQPGKLNPSISKKRKLEDGDILILCTRGVWEAIGVPELLDALEGVHNPEEVCTGLEDVILSQQDRILDNYTIAAMFIDKVYRNPKANRNKKILKLAFTVFILLTMIVLTISIVRYRTNNANYQKMLSSKEKGVQCISDGVYDSAKDEMTKAMDTAASVRAGKKSKKALQKKIVEDYAVLSKTLFKAKEYLDNGFYSNAKENFMEASSFYLDMKEEYKEAVEIEDTAKSFASYAGFMELAIEQMKEGDFTGAIINFEHARKAGIDTGDMKLQTLADDKKAEASALSFVAEGERFLKEAKAHFDAGEYTGALTDYQSAVNAYNTAGELSKEVDVSQKKESAELGVQNAGGAINNQSVQEKEDEAKLHIDAADKKYKEGKFPEAITSYENAKTIYNDLGNSSMLSIVDGYINKAQQQIDTDTKKQEQEATDLAVKEDKAAQYLLEGSELFAEGSYQKAIDKYSLAQELYTEVDKKEEVKTLARIIKAIKKMQ